MAKKKKVMQFRYYKTGNNNNNWPKSISQSRLISGSAFSKFVPIVQLGIQALPGTKFFLNNGSDPIVIGATGIYELELDSVSQINSLRFDRYSIYAIEENPNGYLIVDIIYEGQED